MPRAPKTDIKEFNRLVRLVYEHSFETQILKELRIQTSLLREVIEKMERSNNG